MFGSEEFSARGSTTIKTYQPSNGNALHDKLRFKTPERGMAM